MFSIQQKVVISCAKNSPAVKKGEAKNAQVHVHGVTTTKKHDIKIWPRKHLQYRAFSTRDLHYVTSNIAYTSAILVNQALVNRIIVRSV